MRLRALNVVRHDGEVFEPGAVFDIGRSDGERLIALGAAEDFSELAPAEEPADDEPIDLATLSKKELQELARENGVEFADRDTKEQLIERLLEELG